MQYTTSTINTSVLSLPSFIINVLFKHMGALNRCGALIKFFILRGCTFSGGGGGGGGVHLFEGSMLNQIIMVCKIYALFKR